MASALPPPLPPPYSPPYPPPWALGYQPMLPPRPHTRVWPVPVVALAALLLSLVLSGLVILLALLLSGLPMSDGVVDQSIARVVSHPGVLLLALAAAQLALGVTAWMAGVISPQGMTRRLGLRRGRVPLAGGLLLCAAAISTGLVFAILFQLITPVDDSVLRQLMEMVLAMRGRWLIVAIVVIGVMPAICEELLFRGHMQSRLARRWGMWPAVAISSVAFGVFHMNVPQGIFATVLGLLMGLAVYRSGAIWIAMAMHGANNTAQVLLARALPDDMSQAGLMAMLVGAVLIMTAGWLYVLIWMPQAPPEPEPVSATPPMPVLPYAYPVPPAYWSAQVNPGAYPPPLPPPRGQAPSNQPQPLPPWDDNPYNSNL